MSERPKLRDVFTGTVKEGQFRPDLGPRWRGILARFEGRRVTVSVEPERKHRSLKANAYLWGVVYRTAAEWCGHDEEELHELMKAKFLPARVVVLPTGEEMQGPGSTADLTTDAFAEYVSQVKRFFAEHGVYIPEAGEYEAAS
jgi:hypothetical protein